MSSIRWRPNGVCSQSVGEIPGGVAYVKNNPKLGGPKTACPVRWLGFVCECRSRKLPYARKGKLIATAVTNGEEICSEWRELRDTEYVLCMLVQVGEAHEFGAFAIVDKDNWPIVLSERSPHLTVVIDTGRPSVRPFVRRAG